MDTFTNTDYIHCLTDNQRTLLTNNGCSSPRTIRNSGIKEVSPRVKLNDHNNNTASVHCSGTGHAHALFDPGKHHVVFSATTLDNHVQHVLTTVGDLPGVL